jgi:hypothetical protein
MSVSKNYVELIGIKTGKDDLALVVSKLSAWHGSNSLLSYDCMKNFSFKLSFGAPTTNVGKLRCLKHS